MFLLGGTAAQAQHFHGHAHYHHGHIDYHGHWHAPSYYGSYGYASPSPYGFSSYPSYYSFPPVVTNPFVQPATTIVQAAGVTTSTSIRPNALPPYTGPGMTLRLPAEFPGPVYVQIDKREVEIKPGTEVVLKNKPSYLVEFDMGGDFGPSSNTIPEGAYKFAVGEKGWYMVPDAPANGGLRKNALPGESKK